MQILTNPHTATPLHLEGMARALESGALVSLTAATPKACAGLFTVPVACTRRVWQAFTLAPHIEAAIRDTLAILHLYAKRRDAADAVPFVAVIPGSGSLRHPLLGLFWKDTTGAEVVTVLYQDEV